MTNPLPIHAWEARQRTQASIRAKSVVPAMQRLHGMILEAADAEKTTLNITEIRKDNFSPVWVMIKGALIDLGYEVHEVNGIATLMWTSAQDPRKSSGLRD